jgi:hypothetical protein
MSIKRALNIITEDNVKIESHNEDCLLIDHGSDHIHGFLTAVQYAHSFHIPLQISPCDIWAMIMQGFCQHMKENHE